MSAPGLRVLSFKGRPTRVEPPAVSALRLLIDVAPGAADVIAELIFDVLGNYEPARARAWEREHALLEHRRQMRRFDEKGGA